MPDAIRELTEKHHAYYEVWPYYIVTDEGSPGASAHRVQAGFDVDIYGARTDEEMPLHSAAYELGYSELQKIATEISRHAEDFCSVEVVSFPSTIFLDTKNDLRSRALLRIRISHWRGLNQPAAATEERALHEIEREIQAHGIRPGNTGRG